MILALVIAAFVIQISAGPCWPDDASKQASHIVEAANALYANRYRHYYSQNAVKRWSGISGRYCPPRVSSYSDCSSAATWILWTVFGNGPDLVNGQNWRAGYTGTQASHGTRVSASQAKIGDVALYGSPISHAALYIGGGKVYTHGHDPADITSLYYRSDLNQVRRHFNVGGSGSVGWGSCTYGGKSYTCKDKAQCSGTARAGLCPGPANIQCCITGSSPAPAPGPAPAPTGPSCTVGNGMRGVCISTSQCNGGKASYPGYCPGAANIQCCLTPPRCKSGTGKCLHTTKCGGRTYSGYCPGNRYIKCCV